MLMHMHTHAQIMHAQFAAHAATCNVSCSRSRASCNALYTMEHEYTKNYTYLYSLYGTACTCLVSCYCAYLTNVMTVQ